MTSPSQDWVSLLILILSLLVAALQLFLELFPT